MVEELGEPGTLETLSGDDVGEHANDAGFEQTVALGVGVLFAGGYAGVAQRVAGTRRCGGTNIGRFRDRLGGHARDAVYPR